MHPIQRKSFRYHAAWLKYIRTLPEFPLLSPFCLAGDGSILSRVQLQLQQVLHWKATEKV